MNKLLITLALFSISIHSFSDEKPINSIPKGTLSIGLQPVVSFSKKRSNFGIGGGGATISTSRLGMGLQGRYYIAKNFGIQAIISYLRLGDVSEFNNGKSTSKISGLDISIGIEKPKILYVFTKGGAVFLTPEVRTDIFTGKSITTNTNPTSNNTTKRDATGFQIGAFLGVEWFTQALGVPQLALQASVGLAGFTNSDIGGSESKTTWLLQPNNPQPGSLNMLNATFGFHYYFF